MEISEQVNVAVPSSADAFTTVGTFTVPAGVKRLKAISIILAPDWALTAISVRFAPVIRLIGSGLLEQGDHEYLGKFGGVSVVTTGGLSQNDLKIMYETDIPVQPGGTFEAQVNTLDEAVTAGSVIVGATYDDKAPTEKNSMSQYIDVAGTTTADVYAAVGTFTIPKLESGKDPTRIIAIVIAVAVDQGTSAISLRTTPVIRLSGAGLQNPGLHDYIGKAGSYSHCGSTPSQGVVADGQTEVIPVDIDINPGGQILVEHQFIDETPTASTVAVGFIYR